MINRYTEVNIHQALEALYVARANLKAIEGAHAAGILYPAGLRSALEVAREEIGRALGLVTDCVNREADGASASGPIKEQIK
jgi:hypothetical protein